MEEDDLRERECVMASAARKMVGPSLRPRVLVSEDQDDVLAAIGLLLKCNGYDFEFVKSPAETLNALNTRSFDAVLLDLNYSRDTTSGAEGLELLSKVQALDNTLAVVAMTGWGTIELAVDAMHRGACEFVQNARASCAKSAEANNRSSRKRRKSSVRCCPGRSPLPTV